MTGKSNCTVRMFGALHSHRKNLGQPSIAEVFIPEGGRRASDIARELGLPLEKIEGVFVNRVVFGLDHLVLPDDRIAFIPTGVPGPHRFLLGVHRAGKSYGDEG